MLDPKTEKKGGFGAFVGREHEAHDVREAAEQAEAAQHAKNGTTPKAAAPAPSSPKPV